VVTVTQAIRYNRKWMRSTSAYILAPEAVEKRCKRNSRRGGAKNENILPPIPHFSSLTAVVTTQNAIDLAVDLAMLYFDACS